MNGFKHIILYKIYIDESAVIFSNETQDHEAYGFVDNNSSNRSCS